VKRVSFLIKRMETKRGGEKKRREWSTRLLLGRVETGCGQGKCLIPPRVEEGT